MKKILCFLLVLTVFNNNTYSQTTGNNGIMLKGGKRNPFSGWETFYISGPLNLRVQISYAMLQGCDPKLYNQGYSYWRVNNSAARTNCWLNFKFDYSTCNGSVSTSTNKIDLSHGGILDYKDNWMDGAIRVVRGPYDIKLEDYNQSSKQADADTHLDNVLNKKMPGLTPKQVIIKNIHPKTAPAVIGDRADNNTVNPQVETMAMTNSTYENHSRSNQSQLETARAQQINALNEANQHQAKVFETISNTMASVGNAIITNIVERSIKSQNQDRDQRFRELENEVKTKKGKLINCSECNGQGYTDCTSCNNQGFKECGYCNGTGETDCIACINGVAFGRKCAVCNGTGKVKCTHCFGNGKEVCPDCNGLGKKQCFHCRGTGKVFEVDYSSDSRNGNNDYVSPVENNAGLTAVSNVSALSTSAITVNRKAPNFAIAKSNGQMFNLSSYRGKKVILIFRSSLNEQSIEEFKAISRNLPFLTSRGYSVVGIGLEFSKYQWTSAISENNLPGIQLSEFEGTDTNTTQSYQVADTPSLFLIDKTGTIKAQSNSFSSIKTKIY